LEKLILENVVVIARNLNPSLFSQLWLVKQKIVNEEDFAPNCTFSQFFTQVFTPDFQLLVVPDRLQFTLTEKSKDNTEFIKEKVGTIIRNIPHTPYRAIGTNFHWLVAPDPPTDFIEFMHKLFVKHGIPIYDQFLESDARFGAYLSKDIFGARLRLDIKPVKPASSEKFEKVSESLQLIFNYQLDLAEGVGIIDTMLAFLDQWNQMKSYSEKLVSIVLEDNIYIQS
jgi:hypothetical protein